MGQMNATRQRRRPHGAREIYEALKAQIEEGVYKPGTEVPSTRALASEFGASRTTITAAYEQLLAEGFIETQQGRRTRVASDIRPHRTARAAKTIEERTARLSAFGRRLCGLVAPSIAGDPLPIDFRYGDIAAGDFPRLAWRRSLTRASMTSGPRSLRYQHPQGTPELREALRAYLWRARSVRCSVEQIIVVNGSQQGLDLCARLLLDAGDSFAIENPCYWAARHAFESTGASPVHIPVDEEGLRTATLMNCRARLCYVTPSHQFPLGQVLSASRRDQLLHWATKVDAYVIEDDYDSEFRYDIRPVPPLLAADHEAHVIYVGTISKTLSPLLRVGYLVVPPSLIDAFRTLKRLTDRHTPSLEQNALADFMQTGSYERHVRRLRRNHAQRRSALLEALSEQFGDTVEIQGAMAGLHVVVWFNNRGIEFESDLMDRARRKGVGVYPVSSLFADATAKRRAGFVLGYAGLEQHEIRRGVRRLADVVRSLR